MTTAAPPHVCCFCVITTGNELQCHRCGATKPMEPPKEYPCPMCKGTGVTHQIRTREDEVAPEPII